MKTININDTLAVFVLSGGRLFIGRKDGGLVGIELDEVRHLVDALICLASEHATEGADTVTQSLNLNLTEPEARLLALGLQGIAMRQGPPVFPMIMDLAEKLGLEKYLEELLSSWISHAAANGD